MVRRLFLDCITSTCLYYELQNFKAVVQQKHIESDFKLFKGADCSILLVTGIVKNRHTYVIAQDIIVQELKYVFLA